MTGYAERDIAEFNPADLANLVRFCVQELMERTPYLLSELSPFPGAGIYALFYDGSFPQYQHPSIKSPDATRPIYVGRARKTRSSGDRPLFARLRDHLKSIQVATNLDPADFRVRFLVLHPLWVSTVEDLLIEHYSTLWNDVILGFGLHDPGGKRHTGEVPLWDVLHPGRQHYLKMIERGAVEVSRQDVLGLVESYCMSHGRNQGPPTTEEVDQLAIYAEDEE